MFPDMSIYTISLPIGRIAGDTQIIVSTSRSGLSTASCGLTAAELRVLVSVIPNSTFVPFGDNSTVLVIKNGVDNLMGFDMATRLLNEMNRLVMAFAPPMFDDDRLTQPVQATFDVVPGGSVARETPLVHELQLTLDRCFQVNAVVRCHIGRSCVLRMLGRDFGLDNGDLYLVAGPHEIIEA